MIATLVELDPVGVIIVLILSAIYYAIESRYGRRL